MKRAFILMAGLGLLSSCTVLHQGYVTPSIAVGSANFKIVETNVTGKASAKYFFGLGGLSDKGLYLAAKEDLEANHRLDDNQVFTNYVADEQNKFILIYYEKTVYITADIIEFYGENAPRPAPKKVAVAEKDSLRMSPEYRKIQKERNCTDCISAKVRFVDELKEGQVVRYTVNDESRYGVVESIEGKKVNVAIFHTPTEREVRSFEVTDLQVMKRLK